VTRLVLQELTTGATSNDLASYPTATIAPAPAPNTLLLAWVMSVRTSLPAPPQPTLSGCGVTWTPVAGLGSNTLRLTLFRAMGAAPTSGFVTIDFGTAGQHGCGWSLVQVSGVDTSGTNGQGAVVQSAINSGSGVTSLLVTLSSFLDPSDATLGGFAISVNSAASAGTGFTRINGAGFGTPNAHIDTEWRFDNDTGVDMSFSKADAAGIAVEVRAARRPSILEVQQALNRASTF
jgi:hypothetical protein